MDKDELIQALVNRLAEVTYDCEHCDWSCARCGDDYGMTDTDLYHSAKSGLETAAEHGFKPVEEA